MPSGYDLARINFAAVQGATVANVGDVNGDGRDDVAIGLPNQGAGEVVVASGAGGAEIWRALAPLEPSEAGGPLRFGSGVAKLGDVAGCGGQPAAGTDCSPDRQDADGVPEILVAALGGDVPGAGGEDQGRVYVLDGRTGAIHRRLRLDRVDLPPSGNAEFGYAIASAGDIDGDGEPDAAVGAPGYDESFETLGNACEEAPGSGTGTCDDAGRVFVFASAQLGGPTSGSPGFDLTTSDAATTTIINPDTQAQSTGERFGEAISALGNRELLIGAPLVDVPGAVDAGRAFVIDGESTAPVRRIDSPNPVGSDRFGAAVSAATSAGVFVAAPAASGGQGRAYRFDGGTGNMLTLYAEPDPTAGAGFGTALARLPGDAPAIGAPSRSPFGVVRIFEAGGALAQTICDPDRQPGAGFGASVATLGDTNGDGFDDLAVVGGRVYIFTSKAPAATGAADACVTSGGDSGAGTAAPGGGGGGGTTTRPGTTARPGGGTVVVARVLRRLALKADRKRVRKYRRFRLRGTLLAAANRSVCQRRQKIAVQRRPVSRKRSKRKGSRRFQTFEVAVTRANGRFTARVRPSRTYVYRARVSQTSRCMGAVSKRAKVRVRGRR